MTSDQEKKLVKKYGNAYFNQMVNRMQKVKYYDPEMWTPKEIKEDIKKQYIKKKVCPNCYNTNINEWYFDNYLHKCRDCGFYFEDQ